MRIESCVGVLEVPEPVVRCVESFVRSVLNSISMHGYSGSILYLPDIVYESRLSIEVLSTTLFHRLGVSVSLVLASSYGDTYSFGYLATYSSFPLELVLAEEVTKIVTESCIAIKTIYGWIACCDDLKHVSKILRRELYEVDNHLHAEYPNIEEEVRRRIDSARSIEELFVAIASYPRIALALGAMLPLYLPPQHIEIQVKELESRVVARANPLRLRVEIDPSIACRDGDDEKLGRFFIEIVLHEYLHLALRANGCLGSGAWIAGKPVGMERTVVEITNSLINIVPPNIAKAIGRKLRELIPVDRCEEHRYRALYTDIVCSMLAENTQLIENLLR